MATMMKRMTWKAQSPPSSSWSAAYRSGLVTGQPATSIPAARTVSAASATTGSVKDECGRSTATLVAPSTPSHERAVASGMWISDSSSASTFVWKMPATRTSCPSMSPEADCAVSTMRDPVPRSSRPASEPPM